MKRINVTLHDSLDDEHQLMQRIADLPKDRQHEYLRHLLLAGFRAEQADRRAKAEGEGSVLASTRVHETPPRSSHHAATQDSNLAASSDDGTGDTTVSFAALRQVIG